MSERERIEDALQRANWNRDHAAVLMRMTRRTFFRRLAQYGITVPQPKKRAYRGVTECGGMTHAQIAAALGVSSARVQQIENRAIAKLRAEVSRLGLRVEDLFTSGAA